MKTTRTQTLMAAALACVLALLGAAYSAAPAASLAASVTAEEAQTIAQEAYVYFYPLVVMDVTRKHFTNIEAGKMFARGPMNMFSHARTFPPATFRGATHTNFDTVYSVGWLDLTKGAGRHLGA